MDATILRLPQVKAKTGLGRTTIYSQEASGVFPRSVSLAARAKGWVAREVYAVLDARIAGASEDEIKALVKTLVAARTNGGAR